MTLDPRDGWQPNGIGYCLGCGEPTVCGLVVDVRRLPVCPGCAEVALKHPEAKKVIVARAPSSAPS